MLSAEQLDRLRADGHLTLPQFFDDSVVSSVVSDLNSWSAEFLENLNSDDRKWYVESGSTSPVLRKLDNPVYHREIFRTLALAPRLISLVEQIIGTGVTVLFSQVFCKPPEVGGPKPVHQDNFYFGPNKQNALLTVWVALDEATVENGCLYYGNGSHLGPVLKHAAPPDEPFNLQITTAHLSDYEMSAAPVPAGGISIHHGNTWHQSSANTSKYARRAVAMHYLRNDASLVTPALPYDTSVYVRASTA